MEESTLQVLRKIDYPTNAHTDRIEKFSHLLDLGLITATKLYTGPLMLFCGEYRLKLTESGKKMIS